jgi:hypothetical protein
MIWEKNAPIVADYMNFYMDKSKTILGPHATDHTKLVVLGATYGPIPMKIGSKWFIASTDINISSVNDLDIGSISNGKDYFVYACNSNGQLVFKISLNSTYPSGFDATTSRKIGGFHTLCADVGVISGHTLSGYLTNDILPASIWDLKFRARSSNNGLVYDQGCGKWVQIYLPSDDGQNGVQSVNGATILDTITWLAFVDKGMVVKQRLLEDDEFQSIALGSNEKTNITGSADPVTTGGHIDTASRRMISNIGVEDAAGAMNQWLRTQSYHYDVDASTVGDSGANATTTVYHVASPGGGQLYVKWDNNIPYLCANLPGAADKVMTFGSNQKFLIKHDAGAATGGLPVYVKYDATNIWEKLLINNTLMSKDVYVETNFPAFQIKLKHDASASTNGVVIKYNDTSNRLEATLPSAANTTFDLSTMGPSFNYYTLPDNRGSEYKQGVYGDVKLVAGGIWLYGANAGSRSRSAYSYRWSAAAFIGGRFASEPL